MSPKVLVAMSGGVDSGVAALLLKEQGYEVRGVTMKLFHNEQLGLEYESTCCSLDDVADARRVCHRLDVPHNVFNFSQGFHQHVIERFAREYEVGRTPNPCIDCNRFVKFPLLLERAELLECAYMATGHYARVEQDPDSGRYLLKKGADPTKDQSYVLYAMTQDQLSRTIFPLGRLLKSQVRKLAAEHRLPVADKPESQDICFVPNGSYADFLTDVMGLEEQKGAVLDQSGAVIGRHQGIHRYTIGQRKGLPVQLGKPAYVTGKDVEASTITVGEEEDLYCREFLADGVNWISVERLEQPMEVTLQTRYRQRESHATLVPQEDGRVRVTLREPLRAVAPGQAAVFYQGDVVVGGGTIVSTSD